MAPPLNAGVLLITNTLQTTPAGGRELLCKLNHDALKQIYGDRLTVLELKKTPLRGFKQAAAAFRGHIDGINLSTIEEVFSRAAAANIGEVFIDGSNLGELARTIKARRPDVKIHTFFHNVEARFFWGSFLQSKTVHTLGVALANYLAERKSARYSDAIICLSTRDSRLLRTLYGREATHVSAMAMTDRMPAAVSPPSAERRHKYALFVGSVFYANRAGITWFVEQISPRIKINTCIVGKGFEAYRRELERDGKVKVLGAVDNLADWYLNSHFVIAPIFDGSGMKTKVAEALMYGKKVVGTPEAFSGYEDVADLAGWTCSTADDFVRAIDAAVDSPLSPFDPTLRALYEDKYSFTAARLRLERILKPEASSSCH